jgi:plastocyanin
MRRAGRAALIALFAFARGAQATVYVVTLQGMEFTPATLTIHQGDSIRFVNVEGVHNVHADDGSFVCASDCSLHTAPAPAPWSVVRRFDRLGTLGYYCEQHGDPTGGMRGMVTVVDRVFVDGFDPPP